MQTTLDLQPVPAPIEALTGHDAPPDRRPDEIGTVCGIEYAAWQVHPMDRHHPVRVYAVDTITGEIIEGQQRQSWDRARYRTVPYHSCDSFSGLADLCLRLHLRHRTGRHALDLPIRRVQCDDVQGVLRGARRREVKRNNRAAEERGEYMLDRDGRVMRA